MNVVDKRALLDRWPLHEIDVRPVKLPPPPVGNSTDVFQDAATVTFSDTTLPTATEPGTQLGATGHIVDLCRHIKEGSYSVPAKQLAESIIRVASGRDWIA